MLTERKIRDAKPGTKAVILRDREVVGFGVRVAPGGVKSYVLDYRVNGRRRLATLARCSEINLKEARARAGRELVAIRAGEADPLERRREALAAPTVAELIERFLAVEAPARIERGRMTARTLYEYRKQCAAYIRPAIGNRRVADVKRGDVEHLVSRLPAATRNRVLALVSRLFTLAERWEWRGQNDNPARGVERSVETARDRVLAPSEIQAFGAAFAEIDNPFTVAALRFLVLTGWRTGEALSLRWENVALETAEIVLPATKTGRDRRTVGAAALEVLAGLPRVNGNPFVFAGGRAAAISYKTLHAAFRKACARAGLADVRLHDLRRTLATNAAASGLNLIGLRDLLGHKTISMAARYARRADSVLKRTQDAMADRMAAMIDGKTAEVVEMERRHVS